MGTLSLAPIVVCFTEAFTTLPVALSKGASGLFGSKGSKPPADNRRRTGTVRYGCIRYMRQSMAGCCRCVLVESPLLPSWKQNACSFELVANGLVRFSLI